MSATATINYGEAMALTRDLGELALLPKKGKRVDSLLLETIEAQKEMRLGKYKEFDNVEDLIADLNR